MSNAPAEWVDVRTLVPWDANPYDHPDEQVADIAESIRANGWGDVIVAHGPSRRIVSGHGRRLAALRLLNEDPAWRLPDAPEPAAVPVRWIDAPWDEVCEALAIAANETPRYAKRSDARLAEVLARLEKRREGGQRVGRHGVRAPDLRSLLATRAATMTKPEADDADIDPSEGEPDSRPGEVYELGPHRLICGDCRDPDVLDRLLSPLGKVEVAVTSPPYASQRDYDASSGFKPIPAAEYVDWFDAVQAGVASHLAANGSWFVNIKPHSNDGQRSLYVVDLLVAHVRRWGWRFVDEFCWRNTSNGVPGVWPDRFKNAWEPVFHFCKGKARVRHDNVKYATDGYFAYGEAQESRTGTPFPTGKKVGPGLALPSNVIDAAAAKGGLHEAPYPIALPEFFVRAFSDPGDLIFDPFMGSGTTLIAAAMHDRVAAGCELSPATAT